MSLETAKIRMKISRRSMGKWFLENPAWGDVECLPRPDFRCEFTGRGGICLVKTTADFGDGERDSAAGVGSLRKSGQSGESGGGWIGCNFQ
jgi:hypothetical protein